MKVNYLLVLYFLGFGLNQTFAQTYRYSCQLTSVKSNAWYKIPLHDQLRANAKHDLSDVRIFDGKDTIPYFLRESVTGENIGKNKVFKAGFESSHQFLVETDKSKLNYLQFKVSNHKNRRCFKVLGSYNKKKWYPISDNECLPGSQNNTELHYWYDFYTGIVDYTYLRFSFLDSALEVPDISMVLAPVKMQFESSYDLVSGISYQVEEILPKKLTRIKLFSRQPQWIHQLSFDINEPTYYQRRLNVYRQIHSASSRHKQTNGREFIGDFTLKSDQSNQLFFEHYLKDTLFLEIENDDNTPLSFSTITCLQRKIFLYAYLKDGKSYTLFCGNQFSSKPKYDIETISSSIKDEQTLHLSCKDCRKIAPIKEDSPVMSFYERPIFLWFSLGLVSLVLLYFSWQMLKEKSER